VTSLLAPNPPKPLLRGWSHVVAFVVAGALGGVMIGLSPGAAARAAVIVYVVGLCTMLGVSALYHRLRWGPDALALMRNLDHSTIFLAIAGTYTPIASLMLGDWHRPAMLSIVWGGTLLGIVLQWVPLAAPRWAFTAVYAVVGWSAVIAFPQLFRGLGLNGFLLMLGGGVAYTLGAVVYALKRPDPWPRVFGYHEVFHLFTVIGAGLHLATVGLVVLPRAGG
jgi:hemolysin III